MRERAERDGQDANALADTLLADALISDPDELTAEEVAQIRTGIRQGLADCEAGRAQSVAEWTSGLRTAHR